MLCTWRNKSEIKMSVCSTMRRIPALKSLRSCLDHRARIRSKECLHGVSSQLRHLANDTTSTGSDDENCGLKEKQDRIRVETRVVSTQMVPEIKLHLITPDMEVWQSPFSWPNRGTGHIFSEGTFLREIHIVRAAGGWSTKTVLQ